ncbi:MAG: hypothetical protein FJ109_06335 [Deltaproteobacteria bacterium]|nr:hypothetical protein [Deltaproteobacteria bacterium]
MSETTTGTRRAWKGSLLLAVVIPVVAVATGVLPAFVGEVVAYPTYVSGCNTCHGSFPAFPYNSPKGGAAWPDSLHNVHRDQAYMGTACGYCHGSGPVSTFKAGGSAGVKGYGCAGCHGQIVNGAARGYGLRLHHFKAGKTLCYDCHLADPSPAVESSLPYYYGTAGTKANYPCNDDAGTSEDWSGDGKGLDNDGDWLLDMLDPDCGGCPDGDKDGYENSSCNSDPQKGGGDCVDSDPTIHPGAVETCDGFDQDCDGVPDDGAAAGCDDKVACTADACQGGKCTHTAQDTACNDSVACTVDKCTPVGCKHVPGDGLCDDGTDCTLDLCGEGGCVSIPQDLECGDSNPCTDDVCAAGDGCLNPAVTDGTGCDDGDACTGADQCILGVCAGDVPACGDCLDDSDCLPFEDGDACNGVPTCQAFDGAFACKTDPASVVVCPKDGLPQCQASACNPDTGECGPVPLEDGTSCTLQSACVEAAACVAGQCEALVLLDCNDGNPCTDDTCDPTSGCDHEENTAPCDDSDPCTDSDSCSAGACVGQPLPGVCVDDSDCADAEQCVDQACVAVQPKPDPDVVSPPVEADEDAGNATAEPEPDAAAQDSLLSEALGPDVPGVAPDGRMDVAVGGETSSANDAASASPESTGKQRSGGCTSARAESSRPDGSMALLLFLAAWLATRLALRGARAPRGA